MHQIKIKSILVGACVLGVICLFGFARKSMNVLIRDHDRVRIAGNLKTLISVSESFFAAEGRYPTNLVDIAENGTESARGWARHAMTNAEKDGYEIVAQRTGMVARAWSGRSSEVAVGTLNAQRSLERNQMNRGSNLR